MTILSHYNYSMNNIRCQHQCNYALWLSAVINCVAFTIESSGVHSCLYSNSNGQECNNCIRLLADTYNIIICIYVNMVISYLFYTICQQYHLALESHENWGVVQSMSTDIQNQQEHHNEVTESF